MYDSFSDFLKDKKHIAIIQAENPDGDSLGSALALDYLLKDQFDRNFLFYLFLDQNDNSKVNDPIQQLMCIFKKYKFNNLNDKDIFGNNLLFYMVQSRASLCVDYLLNNGVILSNEQNNNDNSIFYL